MKKVLSLIFLISAIALFNSCSQNASGVKHLSSKDFLSGIENNNDIILLDVRTPEEYEVSRIGGAINIDVNNPNFDTKVASLDKNKTIYVYCLSGSRSKEAGEYLAKQGYDVKDLDKGLLGWRNDGMEIVNTDPKTGEKRLTAEDIFNQTIQGEQLVMVDFYADWCRPCKMMEPFVKQVEAERPSDVKVLKINTDNEPGLSSRFKIQSIPTLMFFKNGEALYYQAGLHNYEQLNELIDKFK